MMKQLLFCAVCAVSLAFLPSCKKLTAQNGGGQQEQQKLGTMSITSEPSGAEISILGKVLPEKTPYQTNPVPEAMYIVKVFKDGYKPAWMPVKVAADKLAEAHFKLVPETATVIIDSNTSGAHVEIEGKDYGDTPVVVSDLPLGTYSLSLSQDGFKEEVTKLIVPNARPIRTNVSLTKNIGTLSLSSSYPERVDVEIVGKVKDTTPCQLQLVPGQYTVRFSKPGFKTIEKHMIVELSKTTREEIELEQLPGKLLAIDSEPSGASIDITGPPSYSPYSGKTPYSQKDLVAGAYTIRLQMDGYNPKTETVILEPGKSEERTITLTPNTGIIVLTVNPPGMNIYLDGKFVTRTVQDKENGSRDISESVRIEKLSAGEHTITVSNKYAKPSSDEQKIRVVEGKTVKAEFDDFWLPDTEIVLKQGSKYRGRLADRYSEDSDKIPFRHSPGITSEYNRSEVQSITPLNIIDEKK